MRAGAKLKYPQSMRSCFLRSQNRAACTVEGEQIGYPSKATEKLKATNWNTKAEVTGPEKYWVRCLV